jgi:hypothetical protein
LAELEKTVRRQVQLMHPDLAADDADRERRTKFMAEVNRGYGAGDIEIGAMAISSHTVVKIEETMKKNTPPTNYGYNDWRNPRSMDVAERECLIRDYEKRTGTRII